MAMSLENQHTLLYFYLVIIIGFFKCGLLSVWIFTSPFVHVSSLWFPPTFHKHAGDFKGALDVRVSQWVWCHAMNWHLI